MKTGWLFMSLAAVVAATPAGAEWHEATSRHFVVYSDDDPQRVQAFTTDLERFDRSLRLLRNVADETRQEQRVTVYVLRDIPAVAKLMGGQSVAGFYIPRVSGSIAFVPRKGADDGRTSLSAVQVLQHEYAHHFMFDTWGGAPFPYWLVEGFAEFNATSRVDGSSFMIGAPPLYRAPGIAAKEVVPMRDLLTRRSDEGTSDLQLQVFYGRAWLLTHYLTFAPSRAGQLNRYLQALLDGRSLTEAAATFGDLRKLDSELNTYAYSRKLSVMTLPLTSLPTGPVTLRALRPGEAATMPVRIRSDRGVSVKTAPKVAAEARKAAAPYPDDPRAQAVLAEAEFDAGAFEAADAAAARALAADPKLARAMMYRGMAQQAMALRDKVTDRDRWKAIRRWFVSANAIDSDDPWPLVAFYQSFAAADVPATRNAEEGLVSAHRLAPYDRSLSMSTAVMLLKRGDVDPARKALRIVAYDPHGGALSTFAGTVLTMLDAKDVKAALAAIETATKAGKDGKETDGD